MGGNNTISKKRESKQYKCCRKKCAAVYKLVSKEEPEGVVLKLFPDIKSMINWCKNAYKFGKAN